MYLRSGNCFISGKTQSHLNNCLNLVLFRITLAKIKKTYTKILFRRYHELVKHAMMVFCVLFICLILPKQARFKFEYDKGKVWSQQDLVSPFSFAIHKTPEQLEKDQRQVIKTVKPIYRYQAEIATKLLADFETDFASRYNQSDLSTAEKEIRIRLGRSWLSEIYARGIITPIKKFQRFESNYNFTLLSDNTARELNTAEVFEISAAKNWIENRLNEQVQLQNKQDLLVLLHNFVAPNYIYDERLTDKIETEALQQISSSTGIVQKGELIVAEGDVINAEIYQKLESLRVSFEGDPLLTPNRRWLFLGQFLLVTLVVSLLMIFMNLFRKDIFDDNRKLALILIIITGMLAVLSWAIKINISSLYYIPYCIVPIIIRILFDTRLALNIHLLVVLIASFLVPNSFEFAFLQISAGMTAIYSIKKVVKREQFLISAGLILVTYCIAYLGILLIKDASFTKIDWYNFVPFGFSVILTLLAYPLIYGFEKLFGITSEITLLELSNTNSPLLRDLAFKAPGTFQHSLQVANLAEAAIYKIGGNALLVRAGALYHDIGKMENPQYFIENQNTNVNPHDRLAYEKSAQIIIQHVYRGVEIARKHRVPELIIDFIKTHHGNTRVDYFYQSFLKNFPEKLVDEKIFRYPGPIPFSKETAVLMLADSVEAASRSLKNPDAGNINDLVERIIDYKLNQNQLIESDITLKDLQVIKQIFKTMLMGIFHVRIQYLQER